MKKQAITLLVILLGFNTIFAQTYPEMITVEGCIFTMGDTEMEGEKDEQPLQTARKKIQCMWNKYRTSIACDLPGLSVPKGNIAKASLEINFSYFLYEAVKDYKLDMNFKDPVDNRTILDFIKDEIAFIKKSPSDMTMKINEYESLYKLLKDNGAKHGKDL
jgi:hypothetical protein